MYGASGSSTGGFWRKSISPEHRVCRRLVFAKVPAPLVRAMAEGAANPGDAISPRYSSSNLSALNKGNEVTVIILNVGVVLKFAPIRAQIIKTVANRRTGHYALAILHKGMVSTNSVG